MSLNNNVDFFVCRYTIMKRCWKLETDRPTMEEVLLQLQKVKEKFKPKEGDGTLSRRPKRPAPKKPPEKKPSLPDMKRSESTEPLMSSDMNRSPSPLDVDSDRTNPLFGSFVTSDEDDWREAEALMGSLPAKKEMLKHSYSNTNAVDLPPPSSTAMAFSPFPSSATDLPPPFLPPPFDNGDQDMDEDDFFLEPPDDVLPPPSTDIFPAPATDSNQAPLLTSAVYASDIIPPPTGILLPDDPLEEDDIEVGCLLLMIYFSLYDLHIKVYLYILISLYDFT